MSYSIKTINSLLPDSTGNVNVTGGSSFDPTPLISQDVEADKASTTKWYSSKAIYDWVTAKLSLKQNLLFEINDSVPSSNVASTTPTLIKTYDVGSLSGFSRLYFHFRGRRTGNNTETMSFAIYLKEKVSGTQYYLGTNKSNITASYFPIERTVTLRQSDNEISVINTVGIYHTDVLPSIAEANTVYFIDYTKEYEIQVFGFIGLGTVATWQSYFSNIVKR